MSNFNDILDLENIDSIPNCDFIELSLENMVQFKHLQHLDLSNQMIFDFKERVFHELTLLQSIDLSGNMIEKINNDHLFEMNTKLVVVNLSSNLLMEINTNTFANLPSLQKLYLNKNQLTHLCNYFIVSKSLIYLNISDNKIATIQELAFYAIPKLITLKMDSNEIETLFSKQFYDLKYLQNLYLNNNLIGKISSQLFLLSDNISTIHLQFNNIQNIDYFTFFTNKYLRVLDLSNNPVSSIFKETFLGTPNIGILKLRISEDFEILCLYHLKNLQTFELLYLSDDPFKLNHELYYFRSNKMLTNLKIIAKHIWITNRFVHKSLLNLVRLHIECLEPQIRKDLVELDENFNVMPKLEHIVLKNLNYFEIPLFKHQIRFLSQKVTNIEIIGLKNRLLERIFFYFISLKHLDLSYSNIERISNDAFYRLSLLELFRIENSKLKVIGKKTFKNNLNLEYLYFHNNCIEYIDNYAFRHLQKLLVLDLSENSLTKISRKMFAGLNKNQTRINLSNNPIENESSSS